ncbi:hypothetical protein CVP04_00580 [Caviibacterium pharyngocola]|uniref:Uncharacterized protein n=1 Tax=Caviibacterium pharyngocola TaxID=28159 RepID=A0A2M8RYM3_9PAST|nr:hypothetical protein CVP04_00580 [Caviibacterium pharyngocola]
MIILSIGININPNDRIVVVIKEILLMKKILVEALNLLFDVIFIVFSNLSIGSDIYLFRVQ